MHIPASTYRIQLNSEFTFDHLENIIDYLNEIGISTIYAAPIFKSTPGSNHGYDVSDASMINPEIGTEEQLKRITESLHSNGMTWLQDIVPNHMTFTPDNNRLMDVLERGPASPYYRYFDINWEHPDERLNGKLMVPFLGKETEQSIADGEIQLFHHEGKFYVKYFDTRYPLSVPAYSWLAEHLDNVKLDIASGSELKASLYEFAERAAQKDQLQTWTSESENILQKYPDELEELSAKINADKDLLSQVLDQLYYRLSYWKMTENTISFRRFFTVNSLLCLSMEDDEVFEEYHTYILELYKKGYFQGLRIDHIDGLKDPKRYVEKLREKFGADCYVVAEKILEAKEDLPTDWPLQGTSGYEFLAFVSQLLTDQKGSAKLLDFYHSLIGKPIDYKRMVFEKKKLILTTSMQGELDNLMHLLEKSGLLPQETVYGTELREAMGVFMAAFPVYRVYPDSFPIQNMHLIEEGFEVAEKMAPDLQKEFSLIRDLFSSDHVSTEESENRIQFLKRFMQFTGPLAAKGVEDTTFYLYNPLISHNEVGDSPETLGFTVEEFHKKMIERQRSFPLSINATATHDTKRGEDSRLRINVLSEMADEWTSLVGSWQKMNAHLKTEVNGNKAPSVNEEYFIYQSIVGGFPESMQVDEDFIERLVTYLNKVLREAKENTNWSDPDEAYEEAVAAFIRNLFSTTHEFLDSLLPFIERVIEFASIYSLSQTLIKLTAPGIPDTYQGCELWDLSYVDPDNRRPVDYEKRRNMLKQIDGKAFDEISEILDEQQSEGMAKLFLTANVLRFRREHAELFNEGKYIPLDVEGGDGKAIAYARVRGDDWVLVVVPLALVEGSSMEHSAQELRIVLPEEAPQSYVDVLTGIEFSNNELRLKDLTVKFPVAILSSKI